MGPSAETGRGPGTWPSGHDEASVFAETAAVRIATGKGPGRWRTAGAGSGAAAVPGAVKQKMNESTLLTVRGAKGRGVNLWESHSSVPVLGCLNHFLIQNQFCAE